MTLFLCVVIFSELSIKDYLVDGSGENTSLGTIYYWINYFLLTFFVIEILLKLFAYGYVFLTEFINVFDSTVVLISYVFLVLDLKVKFISLLRILRLIKVMTEMKRVADAKRPSRRPLRSRRNRVPRWPPM
jgi:voltage-gated sodium channel